MARRIVPFYVWPGHGALWDAAIARLDPGDAVIVNPSSGAGDAPDPLWEQITAAVQLRGVIVLGYVAVVWGRRSAEACRREARQYRDWYGVDGIFWDEAPSAGRFRARRTWFATLMDPQLGEAFWNPGTGPIPRPWWKHSQPASWITFEGAASAYLEHLPVAGLAAREGHLVHSCQPHQEAAVYAHAESQGLAWLHVTAAGLDGRPWEHPWWR